MLNKYLDKEKIIKAYISDVIWLDEIESQLSKIDSDNEEEINARRDAFKLIQMLYKMSYIICQITDTNYTEKYYDRIYDLQREMQIDLTKMLGIEDIWKEI